MYTFSRQNLFVLYMVPSRRVVRSFVEVHSTSDPLIECFLSWLSILVLPFSQIISSYRWAVKHPDLGLNTSGVNVRGLVPESKDVFEWIAPRGA